MKVYLYKQNCCHSCIFLLWVFWETLQIDGVSFPWWLLLSFCKLIKQTKKSGQNQILWQLQGLQNCATVRVLGDCVSWVFHSSRVVSWRKDMKKSLVGLIWDKLTTDTSFAFYCNLQQSMQPIEEQTVPVSSNINKNNSLFYRTEKTLQGCWSKCNSQWIST